MKLSYSALKVQCILKLKYLSILYLDMIYTSYRGEGDLTPQGINVVINSACSVARRTLKNMEDNQDM